MTATVPAGCSQTLLGAGRGLLSWTQCTVPLTAVVNRERDEHGELRDRLRQIERDQYSLLENARPP